MGAAPTVDAAVGSLRVMVVGCGSVGGPMALHLARQQIGELYLVDHDDFGPESILTHSFLQPEAVGQPKAVWLGKLCRQLSPQTRVFAFKGRVQSLPQLLYQDVDAVLLATDNLSAEVDVGQSTLMWRKLLIQASVSGELLVAQVRVFPNATGQGPCVSCGFSSDELAALNKGIKFKCTGYALGAVIAEQETAPTMSVSFLCSLAGDMALVQLYRWRLGLGKPAGDCVIEYCGYTNAITTTRLVRKPGCPSSHAAWQTMTPPRPQLADCSLQELMDAAGFGPADNILITVNDELRYAEVAVCAEEHRQPAHCFARVGGSVGVCSTCGAELRVGLFDTQRAVPVAKVGPRLSQPLHTLVPEEVQYVSLQGAERAILVPYTNNRGEGNE
jgi:hypothetical protein